MSDLLLRLEPPEFAFASRVACRRLAPDPTLPMPWVAYGWDRTPEGEEVDAPPGTPPRLTFEWMAKNDQNWWEHEAAALQTLRSKPSRITVRDVPLDGVPARVATLGTDPRRPDLWASERLCDPEQMREIAQALSAGTDVLVAVPVRGFLAAIAASAEPDAVRRFTVAAQSRFRAGPNPITPIVFVVHRGVVAGRVDVTPIVGEA